MKANTHTHSNYCLFSIVFIVFAVALDPNLAQAAGLDKVNVFMDNVSAVLRGIAIVTVTIAIMWAGYKYLFKSASKEEIFHILLGGLLIGGSTELANSLLT